jgi:integrase
MPSIRPIHTAIRAATALGEDTWYSIEGHRGLWLRARRGMPKTWVFRSVVGGTSRKVVLGRYPDMDFDEAREKMAALKRAAGGANPIEAERARKASERDAEDARKNADLRRPTLAKLATRYLGVFVSESRRALGTKRSSDEERRIFEKHVKPLLGNIKLEDIRTKDIAAMRDEIASASEQRKAVAVVRALLSHAKSDGLIEANPALGIKAPQSKSRTRVLADDELRTLWNGLSAPIEGIRTAMLDALRVQLLTAQRIGEILAMQWRDVDRHAETWLVPAEVAKNGRANLVPLSPTAYEIVLSQEPGKPYVFPGHRVSPMSSSAFAQLVERIRLSLRMADFTSHDLRRTVATRLAGLGILPHIIEAILNHSAGVISGVSAVYNRHSYQPEKKRALHAWAREIERIADEEPKGAVVAIRAKKSGASRR